MRLPDPDLEVDSQEGENYFVSLADLMTGVVFIFVLLLVTYAMTFHTAQRDLEGARVGVEKAKAEADLARARAQLLESEGKRVRTELEGKLDDARQKAAEIDALAEMLKQRDQARRDMLVALVRRLADQGVSVVLDVDEGVVRLPESLLFDSGQATPRAEAFHSILVLASELKQLLGMWCSSDKLFRLESMFIEGHTDNVPIRTQDFADNWELSTARAVNVSRALTSQQPTLAEFTNPAGLPILGVSGYGQNRPVSENATAEGRSRNRRIDLRFIVAYPNVKKLEELNFPSKGD